MASLSDFFSDYTLTKSQAEAVAALEKFLNCPDKDVFILKGYAGTGKTFLTDGLTSYLQAVERQVALCAPTGKAARVLGDKSGEIAVTIHRLIYGSPTPLPSIDNGVESDPAQTASYKFQMAIRPNDDNDDAVYIVDEASMVSNVKSESEYILAGSGYLLQDLIKYIDFNVAEHRRKLIFIGDPAQLPPVDQKISPALSKEYLAENFGLRVSSIEITDVVRQKADSGILKNATKLRDAITTRRFNRLCVEENQADAVKIEPAALLNKCIESIRHNGVANVAIISRTNKQTHFNNQLIHDYLFPSKPKIQCGDILMVYRNETDFANGTLVELKKILGSPIRKEIPLKNRNKVTNETEVKKIQLVFQKVAVREIGTTEVIEKILLENFVYSEEGQLSFDQNRALFVDFLMRNRDINPHKLSIQSTDLDECKRRMKDDPYLHCLIAKWGYAFTCHKAQGSEWMDIYLDCAPSYSTPRNEEYFRWLYTAVTRAKNKLFFYNAPRFTPSTGLTMINATFQSSPIEPKSCVRTSSHTFDQTESPKLESPENFLSVLREAVEKELASFNAKLLDVLHKQYCEVFLVEYANTYARTNVYYNSKQKVTSVRPCKNDPVSLKIAAVIRSLTGFSNQSHITTSTSASPSGMKSMPGSDSHPTTMQKERIFAEDFLQEFFDRLQVAAAAYGVTVTFTRQLQYAIRVTFQGHGSQIMTDFYYNGKEKFTKVNMVDAQHNAPEFMSAIQSIVNELSL